MSHSALDNTIKTVPLEMPVVPFLRDKGLGHSEASLLTSEVIKRAMPVVCYLQSTNPHPSLSKLFLIRSFVYMPFITLSTIY